MRKQKHTKEIREEIEEGGSGVTDLGVVVLRGFFANEARRVLGSNSKEEVPEADTEKGEEEADGSGVEDTPSVRVFNS